jgi:tetratricopeptide (TPR) repeat protein
MAQELTSDYLIISAQEDPPAPPALARALAGAGLGVVDYAPATAQAERPSPSGHARIGTYTAALSGASARIAVLRYERSVTDGMGEGAIAALTRGLREEDVRTLRDGKIALDLRVRVTGGDVLPALSWGVRAAGMLLELTGGVLLDPIAQRALGRRELRGLAPDDPLAHVALHDEPWHVDRRWMHTHGLQKFGRPELDLVGVPLSLSTEAGAFLRELAHNLAAGTLLHPGDEIDLDELGHVVALNVQPDVDHQAPFGRLRLADVPLPGERQGNTAVRMLMRSCLATAARRLHDGDLAGALEDLERVLAADPDDCEALTMKARIFLQLGHVTDALDLGELMDLRAPGDYRGPLITGLALAALQRYREALRALDRAIEREPDAAEAFAARASVRERLGQEQLAAMDRARADYLRT